MKILILGAGQVGSSVAYNLSSEANDITVVDTRPDILRELQDRLDIRTVQGQASPPDVLDQAGAPDADDDHMAPSLPPPRSTQVARPGADISR